MKNCDKKSFVSLTNLWRHRKIDLVKREITNQNVRTKKSLNFANSKLKHITLSQKTEKAVFQKQTLNQKIRWQYKLNSWSNLIFWKTLKLKKTRKTLKRFVVLLLYHSLHVYIYRTALIEMSCSVEWECCMLLFTSSYSLHVFPGWT